MKNIYTIFKRELRSYFAAEAGRLRDELGEFILFNSSFGAANAFVAALRESGVSESPNAPGGFATGRAAHRRALFEHCQRMVPALAAAFPELTSEERTDLCKRSLESTAQVMTEMGHVWRSPWAAA